MITFTGSYLQINRWIAKSFDKWERLGIPHDKPTFPYGSHNFLDGKREFPDDHFFFITITLFLSYSQYDKTTLHALNVPINATHNLMVRMQVS